MTISPPSTAGGGRLGGGVPTAIEAAKRRVVGGLNYVAGDATRAPQADSAAAALMDASGTSNRPPQIPGQFRR